MRCCRESDECTIFGICELTLFSAYFRLYTWRWCCSFLFFVLLRFCWVSWCHGFWFCCFIKSFRYLKWRYWTWWGYFGAGFLLHKPYIQLIWASTSILGTWNVWWLFGVLGWYLVDVFVLQCFMLIQWMRWGESDDVFDVVMILFIDIRNFYVWWYLILVPRMNVLLFFQGSKG